MYRDVERFGQAALIKGRWLLGALSFYGDESGSGGAGTFVLSGYLGRDDTWTEVEDEWSIILDSEPRIDYFHMYECEALKGQFATFSSQKAQRKKTALIDILRPRIRAKRLIEFTGFLEWEMYKRAVDGPLKELYHNPYFFLFHAIVAEISKFVHENVGWAGDAHGPVYFWLDDQIRKVESDLQAQFARVKQTAPEEQARLMDAITFKSDQYSCALQAADLIAWQRHRREENLAVDHRAPRKDFKRLTSSMPSVLMRCKESQLIKLSQAVKEGTRPIRLLEVGDSDF